MKTISNKSEIENILNTAEIGEAFPTSRALPGAWEQANCQEWKANITIAGTPAAIYWIFENTDCESDDAGEYPWEDADKVSRIEIAEKDENGDYDEL